MRIIQILGAILILVASPAMAKDGAAAWIVAQKSGDVRVVRNGLQPASVQLRAALSPGDLVTTGPNGRAMLTKGDDYVVISPGSRLLLPREQKQSGFTRLVQQVGTMLYKVKRTGVPHFAVETPMLAAVVKGTTFSVVVDDNRAAVQVTEGLVEVSSAYGDARRLVEGGMTVYIGRERPGEIIEVRPDSSRLPASSDGDSVKIERSGDVSLATITNLTGGLVREAAVVAPVVSVATPSPAAIVSAAPSPVPSSVSSPVTNIVEAAGPPLTESVVDVVQGPVPPVTNPVVNVVETVVPPVTQPVVDIVETVMPPVVEPVVDIVETVATPVVDPVIEVVETVVTPVVPVVEIVEAVVTPVIEPVVEVVETVVTPIVDPVIEVVEPVVAPVVEVVDPVVTPVVEVVETIVPPVLAPVVNPVTGLLGGLLGR